MFPKIPPTLLRPILTFSLAATALLLTGAAADKPSSQSELPKIDQVGEDVREFAKEHWFAEKDVFLKVESKGKGRLSNRVQNGAVIAQFSQPIWTHWQGGGRRHFQAPQRRGLRTGGRPVGTGQRVSW